MRLLSGLPVALATEHRAIVGELYRLLVMIIGSWNNLFYAVF